MNKNAFFNWSVGWGMFMGLALLGCEGSAEEPEGEGGAPQAEEEPKKEEDEEKQKEPEGEGKEPPELEPLVIDSLEGIDFDFRLKSCGFPTVEVSSSSIGLVWDEVEGATRYAVFARQSESDWTSREDFELVYSGFQNAEEERKYTFTPKQLGYHYTIDVYALNGDEPLCRQGDTYTQAK